MGKFSTSDKIREAVRQWREKAQNDWQTVEILTASKQCPADVVCFHCQQFAEKLLKGVLTLHSIEAPKTHDLRRLIHLAEPFVPELSRLLDASDKLTFHGVETRYPGDWIQVTISEMNEAVELAKQFGEILLPKLGR
jgi:HEPN domain-containing protein